MKYKNSIIRSVVISLIYALASVLIIISRGDYILSELVINKAFEIPVLFVVIVFLDHYQQSKNSKNNKNKFYKNL